MPGLRRLEEGVCRALGRRLGPDESRSFDLYIDLLVRWQRVHRLVGSSDREWIVDHVVLDSLLFLSSMPEAARTTLDFGSGAGLPGVPVKIVRPTLSMTLLEARRRRASFLSEVVRTLALGHTRVLAMRAEEALVKQPWLTAAFDVVVSRCAGRPGDVVRQAQQFVSEQGVLITSGSPTVPAVNEYPSGWRFELSRVVHPTLGAERSFLVWRRAA